MFSKTMKSYKLVFSLKNISNLFLCSKTYRIAMKYKVGIIGFEAEDMDKISPVAFELGMEIGKRGYFTLTDGRHGLSYEVARGAKKKGGWVICYSPAKSFKDHVIEYGFPTDYFNELICTGLGLNGRIDRFIKDCHSVVAISGGSEALVESRTAYNEDKHIGILTGFGASQMFNEFIEESQKKRERGFLFYSSLPDQIMDILTIAMEMKLQS